MCGICGTFAPRGILGDEIREAVGPMTRTLAHRGPDGQGIFTNAYAALGHRRLSIIDRAGGGQPIANEDQSCWIVFNGEIYNHRPLRERLRAHGHVFRTSSDTEVIVHAYEQYGTDCIAMLEGMFAFALLDLRRRALVLARDRVGKKPLYYADFDGVFHFASEVKALRESPVWKGDLDLSGLEGYLSLGYFIAPATIYRHVRQLLPGHFLMAHPEGVTIRKYWDVEEFDTDRREPSEIVRDLTNTIDTAVVERLESEVPLGAFLSGGIDSGIVVSCMREASTAPVITTTVGFNAGDDDEVRAAGLTATHLGTRHHCEVVKPELENVMDCIVGTLDQPFADGSIIPTYYVSGAARRHVTVALSGDGGDESFAGYTTRYIPHHLESRARRMLGAAAGRRLAHVGARWPRWRQLPRWLRAGTVLENLGRDDVAAYFADVCLLRPHTARALLGLDATRDPRASSVFDQVTEPYRRCASSDPVQRAQYADLKMYLPNAVLVKVDRMSMLHSLEVRSPLLDRRVIEAAFRIPASVKIAGMQSKRVLRDIAATRLPARVVKRRKHGFDAPIGNWMAGPYAEVFQSDVLGSQSVVPALVDASIVRQMFDEHRHHIVDHSFALWALWVLARWAALQRVGEPMISRRSALQVAV
jgi:asparagine synthase (glutamine-hydrolysing)